MEEIPYALDTLHADGFTLETNHHGLYLGDSTFDSVFAELNRRKAKIFIHPTQPCIAACNAEGGKMQRASPLMAFPGPMFEFMFDTARAVINLFLTGTVARCPDITFIIPHCGGALPPLVDRFTGFATMILGLEFEMSAKVVKETFSRQFYFDLAGFPWPDQIHGLLRLVDSNRLLYGSDFPFTSPKGLVGMAQSMAAGMETTFSNDMERRNFLLGNAQRMLGLENMSHIQLKLTLHTESSQPI
jgi:6-methylsalicylate decarboxylase